ncbi:unnamed protein product [Moneuplotes crassus]|uniref:RING-CH-type domain-containing protein n=1 Tax=Euplotes crassus TaxID=5936 RepID=A0AAD1Y8J9_EUPCR|nr:unnamed protein product [Moneuplotes crassus]
MGNIESDEYTYSNEFGYQDGPKYLSIKTMTAGKESLELFDYHCNNPISKDFTVKSAKCFYLCRKNEGVFLLNVDEIDRINLSTDVRILVSVVYYQGEYYIYQPKSLLDSDLVKHANNMGCQIMSKIEGKLDFSKSEDSRNEFKAGDFIKFGRICFHVRETSEEPIILSESHSRGASPRSMMDNTIDSAAFGSTSVMGAMNFNSGKCIGNYLEPNHPLSDNSSKTPNVHLSPTLLLKTSKKMSRSELSLRIKKSSGKIKEAQRASKRENFTCRICLCDGDVEEEQAKGDLETALVSPCNCSGTCKYIHYMCLKSWVDSKRKEKYYPHVSTYYWEDLTCELCKAQLPEVITVQGKEISCNKLLDYPVPKRSKYVVLETYNRFDEKSRLVQVLDFRKKFSLSVGRYRDSDLCVPDNSISRLQSQIFYHKKKFYFMDFQSKFGTLRVFRKPLKVDNSVIIQSGCTVLWFKIQNKELSCCEKWLGRSTLYKPHPFMGYELVSDYLPRELKLFFEIVDVKKKHYHCDGENGDFSQRGTLFNRYLQEFKKNKIKEKTKTEEKPRFHHDLKELRETSEAKEKQDALQGQEDRGIIRIRESGANKEGSKRNGEFGTQIQKPKNSRVNYKI